MKILVLEHHPYDSALRVGSHLIVAELLRNGHEVVWISHARSWLHRALGPLAPLRREHADGVVELVPRVPLPYLEVPGLRSEAWGSLWINLGWRLDQLLAGAGVRRVDLAWVSDFTMLPLLDRIQADHVVFRVFDHLDQFRWMPRSIFELMRRYRRKADLVVSSSRSVQEKLAQRGIDSVYLPNGSARWSRSPTEERPRDARVVYIGALEQWFDLPAVELWATALPQVDFDLVGPNRRGLASRLPNVQFRGAVEHHRIPDLLQSARFGLIPFLVNGLTVGVHPIKMYDYLDAGCPVLSCDLPEVYDDHYGIFKYRSPLEGLEILRSNLFSEFDRQALRSQADENRWTARLSEVAGRLGMTF
jgi:glycosyltransferase involved in cell wall biosynthesis